MICSKKLGLLLCGLLTVGCTGPVAGDAGDTPGVVDGGAPPNEDAGTAPTDAGQAQDAGGDLDAGARSDAGTCLEGDFRPGEQICGLNAGGRLQEVCLGGRWTEQALCLDDDVCLNGYEDEQGPTCGLNGRAHLTRSCEGGQWQYGDCVGDDDVCVDGAKDFGEACGLNERGQRELLCVEGAWVQQPDCIDPDVCVDGTARATTTACGLNDRGWATEDCVAGTWADLGHCDECGDAPLAGFVTVNSAADLSALDGVTEVTGTLRLEGFDLETLPPLPDLACVGRLVISSPGLLTSLAGLDSLVEVKGEVFMVGVAAIPTFEGLHRLRRVRGNFSLQSTTNGRPDLQGLESLRWVEGDMYLRIEHATSLQGLESLEAVQRLELYNSQVTSLDGLASLIRVGGFEPWPYKGEVRVTDNDALLDISALGPALAASPNTDLIVARNSALVDLDGLQAVTSLRSVRLDRNDGLTTLHGLQGLTSTQSLVIEENDALVSLNGLGLQQTGYLLLKRNDLLASIQGLEGLTTAGVALGYERAIDIEENSSLTSLEGLHNLSGSSVLKLTVLDNDQLSDLAGLGGLQQLESLAILDNDQLQSLGGLDALSALERLAVGNNAALVSLQGAPSLGVISETISLYGNASLVDLDGLASVHSSPCGVQLKRNDALVSLTGLQNLGGLDSVCPSQPGTIVRGYLDIEDNAVLESLEGLESIVDVGGSLRISGNAALTDLYGLNNLTHAGNLWIEDAIQPERPPQPLTSLDGLDSLTAIDGFLVIEDQPNLTSISALGNVSGQVNTLRIERCPQLASLDGLDNIEAVEELTLGYEFALPDELGSLTDLGGLGGLVMVDRIVLNHLSGVSLAPLAGITAADGTPVSWSVRRSNVTGLEGIGDAGAVFKLELKRVSTPTADLDGLQGLVSVENVLVIDETELESLSGLNSLVTVGYQLAVEDNESLTTLDGLWGVTSVQSVRVYGNGVLPECEADAYLAHLISNGFDGSASVALNDANGTCD